MSDMMTQEEAMNMSSEQAVQILIPMRNMMCDQHGCPISDAVFALDKAIEALSADKPQGYWIKIDVATYRCSKCGKIQIADDVNELNFCCCCGRRNRISRMKGADDE